jgi:6-phosphogluconolactonase
MMQVFANDVELSRAATKFFVQTAQNAVKERGRFTVALTGGSSPKRLYELLAQLPYRDEIPWRQTYVFWGDERWVPPDDPQNNARMAFETLLNRVPVPPEQIFPMSGLLPPSRSAQTYEDTLRAHFNGQPPAFDLILLGMGDDGHTASLFPGTTALQEQHRWVIENYLPSQNMFRITLTAPFINQARIIAFLVFGEKKADALYEVLNGKPDPDKYPAQLIKPTAGAVYWFVDEAAASRVK